MTYFQFYDLPESFTPDAAAVRKKFYELSKRYHPDFHISEAAEKQQEILELSTLNNKAYQVLKDPQQTTAYILELHGWLAEGEKYQLPPDFLMEMMEINEQLGELTIDPDEAKREALKQEVSAIQSAMAGELKSLAERYDTEPAERERILQAIRDVWYRQKYLARINDRFKTEE